MASRRVIVQFYVTLFIAATVSTFTLINAEDSSKSIEKDSKDALSSEDASAQEGSKEKRSQEEILFGNQQNKPNGLVDDMMDMSEGEEEEDNPQDKKSVDAQSQERSRDDLSKDSTEENKRTPSQDEDMMMESGSENWYNTLPASTKAMHYLADNPSIKMMPSEEYSNSLYDQEDLYRRKRQLALPLKKGTLGIPAQDLYRRKRQVPIPLRSSLGQMIQKRGIRLPRRSMRLKRQVDMEDLMNIIGNERYYDEEQQLAPHIFGGRSRTVAKRRVPMRMAPEASVPEYRIPYVFRHRDDGLLTSNPNEADDSNIMEDDVDDINDLVLLPPNARNAYVLREKGREAFRKWLSLHSIPSMMRVQRRSSGVFYPIDYRYVPGYKKRSVFSHGNRGADINRFSEEEDPENEFGKWGHVVQVPEAYASPEDIARLYGLAGLLAEDEEPPRDLEKRRGA